MFLVQTKVQLLVLQPDTEQVTALSHYQFLNQESVQKVNFYHMTVQKSWNFGSYLSLRKSAEQKVNVKTW